MNHLIRRMPRAAGLTASLSALLPLAHGGTVTNCNDSGAGSLRAVIAASASGDTIGFDTAAMSCSTITLTTGQLQIDVQTLTLQGPNTITIDGGHASRVINDGILSGDHTRKLTISGLKIANGTLLTPGSGFALGGCIASSGDVTLSGAIVTGCYARNPLGGAAGGGIYASTLHMQNSTISNSVVYAGAGTNSAAYGGGAYVNGDTVIVSSTISGNQTKVANSSIPHAGGGFRSFANYVGVVATSITGNSSGTGGGLWVSSSTIQIDRSTISGNGATNSVGGAFIDAAWPAGGATISNSTISGNASNGLNGGIFIGGNSTFTHDTIASNTAATQTVVRGSTTYNSAAGLYSFLYTLTLKNSIIAGNVCSPCLPTGAGPSDFSANGSTLSGDHNLIVATLSGTTPPPGTLTADPMLAPLGTNGGPTQTHALLSGSPAIDAGCLSNLVTDQRGPGYPRLWGSAPDIGAYEYGRHLATSFSARRSNSPVRRDCWRPTGVIR